MMKCNPTAVFDLIRMFVLFCAAAYYRSKVMNCENGNNDWECDFCGLEVGCHTCNQRGSSHHWHTCDLHCAGVFAIYYQTRDEQTAILMPSGKV